jgi:hypothetical protein
MRTSFFRLAWLCSAARLFVLGACSSDQPPPKSVGEGCLLNSDCNNPLSCTFGKCHTACQQTLDCPSGERCVKIATGNVCQQKDEVECTYSSECPQPLKCAVDSKCRVACVRDPDCLSSQQCVSHVCADKDQIDPESHDLMHTNPQGGWNGTDDDGGVTPDAGSDVSTEPEAGGSNDGDGGDVSTGGDGGGSKDAASGETGPGGPSCADGGSGLLSFHPSNLSDLSALPADLGDFVFDRYKCTLDTDVPGWVGCSSFGAGTVMKVVTLSDGREATVLFARSLIINSGDMLNIAGRRPLIIATEGKAEINGFIEATTSTTNAWFGGGAPGPASLTHVGICALDAEHGGGQPGESPSKLGIGAGGGAFCGMGGRGSASPDGGVGPIGGSPYGSPTLVPLVGGSSGGSAEGYGIGNHGGGALEIVSGVSILIGEAGIINLGGAVGRSSQWATGGGSGGAILLEAPSVLVRGVLAVNGAGGATAALNDGQDGLPSSTSALGASQYGAPVTRAGSGGAGTSVNGGDGQQPAMAVSASGGGGGAGRIRINTGCGGKLTVVGSAVISPAAGACFTEGTLQ